MDHPARRPKVNGRFPNKSLSRLFCETENHRYDCTDECQNT